MDEIFMWNQINCVNHMFSSDIEEKIKAMVCHDFCIKLLQEFEYVPMNVLAILFFSLSRIILRSYMYATLLLNSSSSTRVLFACKCF